MPLRTHSEADTRPASPVRRGLFACAAALAIGAAAFVVFQAPRVGWVLTNGVLLGLPACALIVVAREGLRVAVAHLLGLRLFGVRWGAGRQLAAIRWRGVQHQFGWLPIGADARVASSHPAQHRARRWTVALVPVLVQALAAWTGLALGALTFEPLTRGFDWIGVAQLANLSLLALHVFVPFETATGMCSDLRMALILSVATIEEDRAARASAHVMAIERALARADVRRAEALLAPAIAQLGREPMLVQLEDRIARIKADPDPESAAREDATTDPFEHSWTYWDRSTGPLPFFRRVTVGAAALTPFLLALFLFSTFHSAPLLASIHGHYTRQAQTVADTGDVTECQSHWPIHVERIERLSAIAQIPPAMQIRELTARARLSACGGDVDRAIRDQSLAIQIAQRLRARGTSQGEDAATDSLTANLALSSELRALSLLHAQRGFYREALRTTGVALRELALARDAASMQADPAHREADLDRIEQERTTVELTRSQILEGMYTRS